MNKSVCILYIDPGTGAMLLTTLLGLITTIGFVVKKLYFKIRFWLSGGKDKTYKQMDKKLPIIIFSDHKRYWSEFKTVCDEFERRKFSCCYWTASEDDPALSAKYEYVSVSYIGNDNRAYAKLNAMNAYVCLSTTPGLDVYQWKRSKNTNWYVHVIHGLGDAASYRMFGLDGFDAVLTGGEHQVQQLRDLEKARGSIPKEVVVVGESYMDALRDRYLREGPKKDSRTVLLAPSWGDSSILARYGGKIIDALLETDYKIIIRPHPQSFMSEKELLEDLTKRYPNGDSLRWDYDNDNFDSLCRADIMISDFSAVIWEYTFIFDRPIIYADISFDPAPYDLAWLDDERWELQVLPLIGIQLLEKDFSGLQDVMDRAISSDSLRESRHELRDIAWKHQGEAAKRIADYVIDKYEEMIRK